MSDLRFDPIIGQWVAIASDRQQRPNEFQQIMKRTELGRCPFCAGNETDTPEPLLEISHSSDQYPWLVRVVPNKYPSFSCATVNDSKSNGTPSCAVESGPYSCTPASGQQEVIVNSPRHVESLSELTIAELLASFEVYRDRIRQFRQEAAIEHAMLFTNCRAEAGASLQHIHSQLIGTPMITDQLRIRWSRMEQYLQQKGRTLLDSIVEWEISQQQRILEVTEHFVVLCPFASRFGYQMWFIPRHHRSDFGSADDGMVAELAHLCQKYVTRLDQLLENPAYNLLFHFAPREFYACEHWFVELFPRLTRPAGFEWGTECWINPFAPEDVASSLR